MRLRFLQVRAVSLCVAVALLALNVGLRSVRSAAAPAHQPLRWRFVNPAPWNDDLHDIVFAEGKFTAVGRGGTVLTSADGASWTVHRTGTSAEFWNVAYGDGTYVVTGGGRDTPAVALSSGDGVRWTQRIRFDKGEIRDVSYGDGRFVAWGSVWPEEETERVTLTSVDGAIWEENRPKTSFPSSSYFVNYVEGRFFALGGERIAGASRDGLEWQAIPVDAGLIGYGWPWEVFTGDGFLGNQPATRAETALALANMMEWERD